MKEFVVWQICEIPRFIEERAKYLQSKPAGYILSKADKKSFDHLLNVCIGNQFSGLGWTNVHVRTVMLRTLVGQRNFKLTAQTILHELYELRNAFDSALMERHFISVDPGKVGFFRDGENLFGKNVVNGFPSARDDIKNAANCLAVDLNTAAVFHLIRATEIGMRILADRLRVVVYRGKEKITIKDSTWSELIRGINLKIESERQKPKAKRRVIRSHFRDYEILANHLNILKDDRNHVMHTQSNYGASEALGVFDRARDFMQKLAKKVSETNN
ncbi:MAG: hypothetical protein ABSH11_02005 [Verrucomicrobiota bacterium]|jgi:hypothetical protein